MDSNNGYLVWEDRFHTEVPEEHHIDLQEESVQY